MNVNWPRFALRALVCLLSIPLVIGLLYILAVIVLFWWHGF